MIEMSKTEEELIAEESEVDLTKPVIPPPEVAAILNRGFSTWKELPSPHEYDLDQLTTSQDVSEMLWDMYLNPDNPAVAYLPKGRPLPPAISEFQKADYIQIQWEDHYYRRTNRGGDWFRLPQNFWLDGDGPRAEWPAAIRKIVRNSSRYYKLNFELSQKAVRSTEQFLRKHELQEAMRPRIFEAKPSLWGFSFDIRAFWAWLRFHSPFRNRHRQTTKGKTRSGAESQN